MKKLEEYKLDSEYRPELHRRLYNYILTPLQAHEVRLEDLEVVVEMIKETYKKEAVIPSLPGIIKPLDENITISTPCGINSQEKIDELAKDISDIKTKISNIY